MTLIATWFGEAGGPIILPIRAIAGPALRCVAERPCCEATLEYAAPALANGW
jgi:hypothetical protein